MGGMKLRFLDNAVQRVATGKKLPIKPLEAVILYGTAAQRVKVVTKLVKSAASLANHKLTYHLVCTVCDACDNTVRVEMLFAMRRQLLDLSRSRYGNVVVQKLLDTVPLVQRKEMAQGLVEEALDLSRHMFGNHVVQKMLTLGACQDVLFEVMTGVVVGHLATHPVAQHVVAKLLEVNTVPTLEALFEDDETLEALLGMKESAVLTAIFTVPLISDDVKEQVNDALLSKVEEYVAETGMQHFAMAAAIAHGTPEQRGKWHAALQPHLAELMGAKGHASVVAELVKCADKAQRKALLAAVTKTAGTLAEVATNAYTTLTLRAVVQSDCAAIPAAAMTALLKKTAELATSSASSVLLQQLLLFGTDAVKAQLCKQVTGGALAALMTDVAGAHVVQAVLEHGDADSRSAVVQAVLAQLPELVVHAQGTHVVQKALGAATDAQVTMMCEDLAGLRDVKELSLDCHACYAVQAVLRETKARQLDDARRLVMNGLKPHVFRLSVSPWAGHIVLDAMFAVGSAELKEAIRDVIFLKCEAFLSEVPASKRARADRLEENEDGELVGEQASASLRDAPVAADDDGSGGSADDDDDEEEEVAPKRKVRATEKKGGGAAKAGARKKKSAA
jgi:hypothetical protein